jgi:Zn finger protein HypA/HybF involved in hydrogenase expression
MAFDDNNWTCRYCGRKYTTEDNAADCEDCGGEYEDLGDGTWAR